MKPHLLDNFHTDQPKYETQTIANISLNCLLLSVLTKHPNGGHVANESHYSYTGYAIAQ